MNNRDIEKELKNLDIPDIQIESHRRKLREALLVTASVKGLQPEATLGDKINAWLDRSL